MERKQTDRLHNLVNARDFRLLLMAGGGGAGLQRDSVFALLFVIVSTGGTTKLGG